MILPIKIANWKLRLKSFIQRNRPLLRGYHYFKAPPADTHNHLMLAYAQLKKAEQVTFVQIGAHTGGLHDPLDRHIRLDGWRGVFVEPQGDEIMSLQESYSEFQGLKYAPFAIDIESGRKSLFKIKVNPYLPAWITQLSSFYKEVPAAIAENWPEVELIQEEVQCVSLDTLFKQYDIEQLDVLLIDTEGHDAAILGSLDLKRWQPDLILFEHYHLQPQDYERTLAYLKQAGYLFWKQKANTLAVRPFNLHKEYNGRWLK